MNRYSCSRPTGAVNFGQARGFVLVELLMVVGIIALITGVSMISFGAMWGNQRFKRQAEDIVNTLQMAQDAAATTGRRYQVAFNTTFQGYVFREYTETTLFYDNDIFENALSGLYDDSLIKIGRFNESMTLFEVIYDYYTEEELAGLDESNDTFHFVAGKAGWNAGGKIVLFDDDGMPWTIVVQRFASPVKLYKGEVDLYIPQKAENVQF